MAKRVLTVRVLTTLLALCALTLTACGDQSGSADQQSGSQSNDSSSQTEPTKTVAHVNDEAISAAELDAQVQAMSRRGQRVDPKSALDQLIELKLLAQKAESKGLPEQPEIAAAIKRQRSNLLAQHLIRAHMSDFQVDEDQLRQAYKERVNGMGGKEYKASHILLDDKATAEDMIKQLDNGAEFKKLAQDNSTGPTASRGGDLGWFSPDQMVQPFMDAVKEMEPGDHSSEPVKTQFGWHVIMLEDTRPVEKPKFEKLKPQLRNQLIGKKIQDYIASLRKDADVKIEDDKFKSQSNGDGSDAMSGSGDDMQSQDSAEN